MRAFKAAIRAFAFASLGLLSVATARAEDIVVTHYGSLLYGVPYGPNGTDYTGTLMVPTAADIAAATLAALQASAIPVNVQRVNGVLLQGTGTPGDSMRPA